MSKRADTCIERWWQGVGVGEVEPTTKVINAPSGMFRDLSGILFWWLGGNPVTVEINPLKPTVAILVQL